MVNVDPRNRPSVGNLLSRDVFKDFVEASKKIVLNGRYTNTNSSLLKNGFVQSFQVCDNKDENKK